MDVRVLGPIEASVEGRPIALGGGKPRALLAMLALKAGSAVSTERLIDGLWGEQPPATASKLVQLYVSQLRKALAAGESGAQIVTRVRGYELRLGPGDVDARRFERLVADGAAREALALWRGPALADLAAEPFAASEARRLEGLRMTALELAIDADLAAGRHREVVGELEALVAEEPLREKLHAQRMLALYRSGRQAEALDAYRQARAALIDAIGVEPGPELRRLQDAILRQEPGLEPPRADAGRLPPELFAGTPLARREADLDLLREHWRRAHGGAGRLVLLAGARGIGKTRLAAELAAEVHRDGAPVLYASGAGGPAPALAAFERTGAARRPTLVVLDDLDRAGGEVRAALGRLVDGLAALPVLIVAIAEEGGLTAAVGADATLTLVPLDADGIAEVALLYASEAGEAAGAGVAGRGGAAAWPQRVHRLAGNWARADAARRLDAAAVRTASERAGLREAEDALAGNVVELQAARERAEVEEGDADGVLVCPFKGLACFRS